MRRFLALLLAVGLAGCPVPRDDDDAAADDDDNTDTIQLPDPATGEESDRFWTPDRAISTPETAWPAGTLDQSAQYIEADVPEGATAAWYVFEAGADFTFDVELYDDFALITDAHVHDGAGLVLGGELPVDVTLTPSGGGQIVGIVFDVVVGGIYVLEIRVGEAGFF